MLDLHSRRVIWAASASNDTELALDVLRRHFDHERYPTRQAAMKSVGDYTDNFHNVERRQLAPGPGIVVGMAAFVDTGSSPNYDVRVLDGDAMTFTRQPLILLLSGSTIGFGALQWTLIAQRLDQLFTLCLKVGQGRGHVLFGIPTSIVLVCGSVGFIICGTLVGLANVPQTLLRTCARFVALLGAVLISAGLLVWIAMLTSPMVGFRPL